MNREVKFRAWDKEENKMISGDNFAFEEYAPLNDLFHNNFKKFDFMQYTGCKDANGKEIYEGDLIRLEGVDDREIGSTWEHIGKIVYKRGAFFVCYFDYYADGDEELICDAQVEFGTVIGNVYENKELLEEE